MTVLSRWRAAAARTSPALRFRLAGGLVAVGGAIWSAWVWFTATDGPARSVPFGRLKVEERQLEIIGGKFAVEAARLTRWFDGLWVGRDLAVTLMVLTMAIAAICFWLGAVAARPPIDDEPD